jgi:hypothetical protein
MRAPHLADAAAVVQWADRVEARTDFPRLVRRLIRQTNDQVVSLEMRAAEGTGFSGYDGQVEALKGTPFVPAGRSVWELGVGADPYYLASFYPALLALGALPAADWATKTRKCTGLAVVTVALSGAIGALIALPLLPERDLQGSIVMAVNPDQGETVGWPRYVVAVSHAWQSIPPRERRHTAIFTVNYGEAGAIDVLGHPRGLPHAYSGHDGFAEWGIPTSNAIHALLSGYHDARDAAPAFAGCHTLATTDNGVGLQNQEQGLPLLLCRRTAPWPALWPQLTHLG